ncbi:hypothetical protein EXU30_06835 [Shewanella maritima]|uniref:Cytochrome c-552/4 domain-containing protein n=1 Tax=Shewanella maritima TaxID=2520507 RepID=A0A411PFV6_9GAMM|nr:Ig-like domain-containing protein [Shewanella maritima]QBF82443.1 hypothetical protein EXU30_06835 [Shewanella maritima]
MNAQLSFKKLLLASMVSMLFACGSDNDDPTLLPENIAPVANADQAELNAGATIEIDVLANDTDADGDTLTITAAEVESGTGSVTIENNKLVFVADTVGETILSYSIEDGNGGEASTKVTITVLSNELAYVGTQTCLGCHSNKDSFLKTGHNFKIQKISNGEEPSFPYTPESTITGAIDLLQFAGPNGDGSTNNTLGAPSSYDDVTYVVGGYHWKMRWLDADGYIVTGNNVQYNIRNANGELNIPDNHLNDPDVMGDYKASEFDYQYKCGNCHVTGWKRTTTEEGDERNLDRQDDLPGMGGTFAAGGVQCEACHGAGSLHASSPSKDNIAKNAQARTTEDFLADDMGYGKAVTCAECHTRDGEKDYPSYVSDYNAAFPDGSKVGGRIISSGGLSKHHQTADEMLGVVPEDHGSYKAGDEIGPKQDMACSTCHEPHMSTKNQDSADGIHTGAVKECTSCHQVEFTSAVHGMVAECTDCHMPKLAKSAVKTGPKMGSADVVFGDVKSHLFTIDLSADAKQFTADGKFQMPWSTAEFSCGTCHSDYQDRALQTPIIHK